MSDIQLSRLFRQTRKTCKANDSDFKDAALCIFDDLLSLKRNQKWAETVGEIVPRIFTRDVNTGYDFFHNNDNLKNVWILYTEASKIIVQNKRYSKWKKQGELCNIACITGVFWDDVAPTKAIADFALNLDRDIYNPTVISTNQFFTHKRKKSCEVPGSNNTHTGQKLAQANIDLISLPPCENNTELAYKLISICQDNSIDLVVSNGSLFSFPEACLAASGVVKSFFNMHQGFPLYSGSIDAICHFIPETKKTQLELWQKSGGIVLDYEFGIPLNTLPEKPDNGDKIFLISVSNHLTERLSNEFCTLISEVMIKNPNINYTLLGSGNETELKSKFPSELHPRIECPGAQNDQSVITAWLRSSDIYVNEFPIGGGRVILEAMASELPVIAMRCGDRHVENIGATLVGKTAIQSFSKNDYKHLLCKLIDSKEERKYIGKMLRERVEKVYDISVTVKKLSKEIYDVYKDKCFKTK